MYIWEREGEGEREREEGRKWKKDDKYEHIRGTVHISIHIHIHILTLSRALMSAPSLINISMAAVWPFLAAKWRGV